MLVEQTLERWVVTGLDGRDVARSYIVFRSARSYKVFRTHGAIKCSGRTEL